MNSEGNLNLLKQVLTLLSGMAVIYGVMTESQATQIVGLIMIGVPALTGAGSMLWSVYAHWNMKKVPEQSTALMLPGGPEAKGSIVDLAPMTGLAKVVGALLVGFMLLQAVPAFAQQHATGKLPFDPLNLNNGGPTAPGGALSKATNDLAALLNDLADFSDAATLATEIPALQDNVGAACWAQFSPIQALIKLHPLPVTLKAATDIEALRLLGIALNQVCSNPNCGSMWNDAGNAANSIAGVPIPVSLTSICSKIPVISTAAAAAGGATVPVGTITPAVSTPVAAPAGK